MEMARVGQEEAWWEPQPTGEQAYLDAFAEAAITKVSWAGWLEQQKFIFLSFWRLQVQDQGVDTFGFS